MSERRMSTRKYWQHTIVTLQGYNSNADSSTTPIYQNTEACSYGLIRNILHNYNMQTCVAIHRRLINQECNENT